MDRNVNMSIYQYWRETNKEKDNLNAVEYFGHSWTFAEINRIMVDYAKAISSLIAKKDESLIICAPFIPSTIAILYASNIAGIRVNLISPELLKADTIKHLNETETNTLLVLDRFYPAVEGEISSSNVKNIIISSLSDDAPDYVKLKLADLYFFDSYKNLPKHINYLTTDDLLNAGKRIHSQIAPAFSPNSTAFVLYTGGSTGIPKGVELINETINIQAKNWNEEGININLVPGDRNMLLIPPNHPTSLVVGLTSPCGCKEGGVTQVCQPIYNRFTFSQDIINNRINAVVAAPSHYATLQNCDLKQGDFQMLKNPFCGGEAVSLELSLNINKALTYAGATNELIYGYGMSELGPLTHVSPYVRGLGNKVGKPLPGVECRIVDDYGIILDDNKRGNLEIKAECVMKGYFKNPKLTKAFFHEDGFAKTGDIAIRDNDGYYEILGRATDSFVANNGKKVFLFDIENFVYSIKPEAIAEAEAVGLPVDGTTEKIPVIHAVLNPEYQGKEKDIIETLDTFCKDGRLDYNEIPRGYKIRTAFGTNPISTKRDYKALAEERTDYYINCCDGEIEEISFANTGEVHSVKVKTTDIKIHKQKDGSANKH
jgi:long-chain acyl-CoA synthetase